MVAYSLAANPQSLGSIAKALQKFCDTTSKMDEETKKRIPALGKEAAGLLTSALDVVQSCVPGVLKGLAAILTKQLLRSNTLFSEKGNPDFLPAFNDDSKGWFGQCLAYCAASQAESMKDTLISMAQTLTEADFNLDPVIRKYMEHEFQALCCICADSLCIDEKAITVPELKVKVSTLAEGLGGMKFGAQTGDWVVPAKTWVAKNILQVFFGNFFNLMNSKISDAINAQPDGLESLIGQKNQARLRVLVFAKETHLACTNGLEDYCVISKKLDDIVTAVDSCDLMQGMFLTKCKSFQSKVSKVKSYASVVHGLNLLCHRFSGKGRVERSALLRECLDVEIYSSLGR